MKIFETLLSSLNENVMTSVFFTYVHDVDLPTEREVLELSAAIQANRSIKTICLRQENIHSLNVKHLKIIMDALVANKSIETIDINNINFSKLTEESFQVWVDFLSTITLSGPMEISGNLAGLTLEKQQALNASASLLPQNFKLTDDGEAPEIFLERLAALMKILYVKSIDFNFPKSIESNLSVVLETANLIAKMDRLENIAVSKDDFSKLPPDLIIDFVEEITQNKQLHMIDLSGCRLFDYDITTLHTLAQYKSLRLFKTFYVPANLEECLDKKNWYARYILLKQATEGNRSSPCLPFKVSSAIALNVLVEFLGCCTSDRQYYVDLFVSEEGKWVDKKITANQLWELLKVRLQYNKNNIYINLKIYLKDLQERQILYAVENILKYYPNSAGGIDDIAGLPGKSEQFMSGILHLRLSSLQSTKHLIDWSKYQLHLSELRDLIPKYNLIPQVNLFMRTSLNGMYLDKEIPELDELRKNRVQIPSLIICNDDSMWLYGKDCESGALKIISLADVQLPENTLYDIPRNSNSNRDLSVSNSDIHDAVKKLLIPDGGTIDLSLHQFVERERIELFRLFLENCCWDSVTYIFDISDLNLSWDVMFPLLKEYSHMIILGDYASKYMASKNKEIPYEERLSLVQEIVVCDAYVDISDFQLEEQDRIKVLRLAIEINPEAVSNISEYQITSPQIRLELFLTGVQHNSELFYAMNEFELSALEGNLGKIFNAWESNTAFLEESDDIDMMEIGTIIKENVLPSLSLVFKNVWPRHSIWQSAIDRLMEYELEEDFDVIKMLNMAFWLIYTSVLANEKISSSPARLFDVQLTLKEIITYADPKMRYVLSNALMHVCANDNSFVVYKHLLDKGSVRTLLPAIFIALEIGKEPSLESRETLTDSAYNNILKKMSKSYKHGGNLRPCVAGIHSIFQAPELTIYEKIELTSNVLCSGPIGIQTTQWFLVQGLQLSGEMNAITPEQRAGGSIELAFHQVLVRIFNLSQESVKHYHNTFGQQNAKTALLTYYGKMLQLSVKDRDSMLKTLKKYVSTVLSLNSQDFYDMRYDTSHNRHLEAIFSKEPWLENPWRNGASERYDDFVERHNIVDKPCRIDLSDFLVNKVLKHQHLPGEYALLFKKYLSSPASRTAIVAELLVQQRGLTDKIDPRVKSICEVQLALIEACKYSGVNTKIQAALLKKIKVTINSVSDAKEFKNDLSMMIKHLLSANIKHKVLDTSRWRIVDTDNYWWLFMAGTFVEGSCQRVDGSPDLNKCLMGYVINGDYRMIAIVDDSTIIARCMVHLMDDPLKSKIVLFIEEAYPTNLSSVQRQVIEEFAIERAIDLGLTITNLEGSLESISYGYPLMRKPGGAPYVYCDATFGSAKDGEITIEGSQIVYDQAQYALTHLATIRNQCNSNFNYLAQAWQSGAISQITWQQQGLGYQPVSVTLKPSINHEQASSLLCLYQHYVNGQTVTWDYDTKKILLDSDAVVSQPKLLL
ncbi:MAG: hypothetical protein HOI53_06150 [Francisellaceae bacterium]|nr:hypothetical protein [Francisellaceae bacterium]MBT6207591.1 hypothetical protein [Francisellaceae bacterium]MBT6538668.1 hypothetical protein [Francisellaceae bacterium]